MNLSSFLTFVAALSMATERVTEFIKRLPWISSVLSERKQGTKEDIRVVGVQLLAVFVGMILCHSFPKLLPNVDQSQGNGAAWGLCFGYGLLASGGSGFWNSALDTFRGVKQKMGE
jgi:drug/metabolite transporter (DMT)-like permease